VSWTMDNHAISLTTDIVYSNCVSIVCLPFLSHSWKSYHTSALAPHSPIITVKSIFCERTVSGFYLEQANLRADSIVVVLQDVVCPIAES